MNQFHVDVFWMNDLVLTFLCVYVLIGRF